MRWTSLQRGPGYEDCVGGSGAHARAAVGTATVAPLFVRDDGELTRCEPLFYNGSRIHRVYPLMGGGVAEWLKAAVC